MVQFIESEDQRFWRNVEKFEEVSILKVFRLVDAVITTAGDLPARSVVHTVGPIYGRHDGREAELLAACYKNSLQLAVQNSLTLDCFPRYFHRRLRISAARGGSSSLPGNYGIFGD